MHVFAVSGLMFKGQGFRRKEALLSSVLKRVFLNLLSNEV